MDLCPRNFHRSISWWTAKLHLMFMFRTFDPECPLQQLQEMPMLSRWRLYNKRPVVKPMLLPVTASAMQPSLRNRLTRQQVKVHCSADTTVACNKGPTTVVGSLLVARNFKRLKFLACNNCQYHTTALQVGRPKKGIQWRHKYRTTLCC